MKVETYRLDMSRRSFPFSTAIVRGGEGRCLAIRQWNGWQDCDEEFVQLPWDKAIALAKWILEIDGRPSEEGSE